MRTTLVMTQNGGQGKTTVSQLIALGCIRAGRPRRLSSADSLPDESSKFGRLFPGEVRELGLGATLAEIKQDPEAALEHWDCFGELLVDGGFLVDIGANLSAVLLDWAVARNAGRELAAASAPPIELVVPVRAESQPLENAISLLETSFAVQKYLPVERRYIVFNEASGAFERYGTRDDLERLEAMMGRGLVLVKLKKCASRLWPYTERVCMPIATALDMETEDVCKTFGMNRFAAAGALRDLADWMAETLDEFERKGLIPQEVGP